MKKQDAVNALNRIKEGRFVTCKECDKDLHQGCMCCVSSLNKSAELKTIESYLKTQLEADFTTRLNVVETQILDATQELAEEKQKAPSGSKSEYITGLICGLNNERMYLLKIIELQKIIDKRKEEKE